MKHIEAAVVRHEAEYFKAGFIERGASRAFAQGMTDMMRAKNEGLDNAEPRTPENRTQPVPAVGRRGLKPAVLG